MRVSKAAFLVGSFLLSLSQTVSAGGKQELPFDPKTGISVRGGTVYREVPGQAPSEIRAELVDGTLSFSEFGPVSEGMRKLAMAALRERAPTLKPWSLPKTTEPPASQILSQQISRNRFSSDQPSLVPVGFPLQDLSELAERLLTQQLHQSTLERFFPPLDLDLSRLHEGLLPEELLRELPLKQLEQVELPPEEEGQQGEKQPPAAAGPAQEPKDQ